MSRGCKDTGGIFWRTQGSAPAASDTRSCRRLRLRCCCAFALEGEVPRRCAAGGRKGLSPLGLAGAKACVLSCCHKNPRVWVWDREAACPAAAPGGRQRGTARGAELGVFLPLALLAGPATPRCSPSTSPPPCPTGDGRPCPLPGSSGATGASASRGTGWGRGTARGEELLTAGRVGQGWVSFTSVCLSVCLLLSLLLIR